MHIGSPLSPEAIDNIQLAILSPLYEDQIYGYSYIIFSCLGRDVSFVLDHTVFAHPAQSAPQNCREIRVQRTVEDTNTSSYIPYLADNRSDGDGDRSVDSPAGEVRIRGSGLFVDPCEETLESAECWGSHDSTFSL